VCECGSSIANSTCRSDSSDQGVHPRSGPLGRAAGCVPRRSVVGTSENFNVSDSLSASEASEARYCR
jgi:hypothetical protein